jgi:hypothetical protein
MDEIIASLDGYFYCPQHNFNRKRAESLDFLVASVALQIFAPMPGALHASESICVISTRAQNSPRSMKERPFARVIDESCTLYGARRFVIECPAPSTTIFPAMKNSIILISALYLVTMLLASCNSVPSAFAPDETATTGVTRQTSEAPPERSAEDSVNSVSGGHY